MGNKWMLDADALREKASSIRQDIIEMIHEANAGHPGGALSAADVVTALYFNEMNIDPENLDWAERDRFILSKGHACPVWYAALLEAGYFPREHIHTLRKFHSLLQGHPDMKKTPGVDMTSGSLGNGLSAGIGMALAAKYKNLPYRTYVMMGDGEIQEGMVWEAAMTAVQYRLDNIVAIVDNNGLQVDGHTCDIVRVEPIADKFSAFGWYVIVIDGHDMDMILDALREARSKEEPVVIIANTVKGKGVSFMEDVCKWHGLAPTAAERDQAMAELRQGR